MQAMQDSRKSLGLSLPEAKAESSVWNGHMDTPVLPLFAALIVIVDLVKHAAAVRFEGTVINAGRAAGVSRAQELLTAFALIVVADDQIAGDEIYLFPMIVHEWRRRIRARIEA